MASRFGLFLVHSAVVVAALALTLLVYLRAGGSELVIGNWVLRAQDGMTYPLHPPSTESLTRAPSPKPGFETDAAQPRNLVLFIGDGMGLGHVSAASALLEGPGGNLAMTATPFVGLVRTWTTDDLTGGSAASATAMATGFKTRKKAIGVVADGRAARNLFEAANAGGLATGMITTSGLWDATPAGFIAHTPWRTDYEEIFEQTLASGIDVLIGGDWSRYRKAQKNRQFRELVNRAEELGAAHGYTVIRDENALQAATTPLLAVFPPREGGRTAYYGPDLTISTRRALDLLEDESRGFVLVVETEKTDNSAHDNDIDAVMEGMRELDDAVSLVLTSVLPRADTLVVVTADHDAGTLTLIDGEYDGGSALVRWASGDHSSMWVPLFAFGPGADQFTGIMDNTELAPRLARLLGLESLPQLADSVAY
jgi:alkaline phosphatase